MQSMHETVAEIMRLQKQLDREIMARRKELGVRLHGRFVDFEQGVAIRHRQLRQSVTEFLVRSSWITIMTAPAIYSMAVPLFLLDLWATFYQHICFRAYRIPRVIRSDYILFDRGSLTYLNWIEALNCAYCSYASGVIVYVREIASRTEQYWCPIKHALKVVEPHQRYYEFLEYGDADGYRARLDEFRERLRQFHGQKEG